MKLSYGMRDFWWKITWPVWIVKRFVKKVWKIVLWLPVLWKDEEWDHTYLLRILRKKIHNMSRYHSTVGAARYEGWEENVAAMDRCVLLLTRLIDNDYFQMACGIVPGGREYHDSLTSRVDNYRKDGTWNSDWQIDKDVSKAVWLKEEELEANDMRELLAIINSEYKKWWE